MEAPCLNCRRTMSASPWRTMILVALRTGLRFGEVRALRWPDVLRGHAARGVIENRPTLHVCHPITVVVWCSAVRSHLPVGLDSSR